jgi:hypothetical protein
MSDGERVEQLICDWLDRNYLDGPTWYGRPALPLRSSGPRSLLGGLILIP